LSFQELSTP